MDSIPLSSLLDRLNGHCLQGDVDPNQLLRGTSSVVHGKGKYRFPSGLIYEGEFQDSMFDGEGTLFFPNDGGRFVGAWKRGKLVHGKYFFQDNLEYRPENWQYCTDGDRRFWTEIQNGIRIADAPALSDKEPMPWIPVNCLDLGNGYFDPSDQCIYNYDGQFVRVPSKQEADWAIRKCRVGLNEEAWMEREAATAKEMEARLALEAKAAQTTEAVEAIRVSRLKDLGLGRVTVAGPSSQLGGETNAAVDAYTTSRSMGQGGEEGEGDTLPPLSHRTDASGAGDYDGLGLGASTDGDVDRDGDGEDRIGHVGHAQRGWAATTRSYMGVGRGGVTGGSGQNDMFVSGDQDEQPPFDHHGGGEMVEGEEGLHQYGDEQAEYMEGEGDPNESREFHGAYVEDGEDE